MKLLIQKYKMHWSDKEFFTSFVLGLILLGLSLVINYFAGMYATRQASNAVTDLFLNILPVVDVSSAFVEGPIIFLIFVLLLFLEDPKRIPFGLKAIALFVIIRSAAITLTHLGPPLPHDIFLENYKIRGFSFGGDLFFSGHTGLPFLMALLFWDHKFLRGFFVLTSIAFGFIVLLGHLHYSVDVFSAFFITYGIYHMARVIFKKDYRIFTKGLDIVENI